LGALQQLISGRERATPGLTNSKRGALRSEQEWARDGVARGQIQPLDAILRNVGAAVPGTVLSTRLQKDITGAWMYTMTILSDAGRYRRVTVDAARNIILQIR
jgi:uncharacterized membrane protein YkoI